MNIRIFPAAILLALSLAVEAQQAAVPFAVARDADGDVIGPVVGFNNVLNRAIVRIIDPGNGNAVFLELNNRERLVGQVFETYYSAPGCTGTPYHDPAGTLESTLMPESTGFTYGTGQLDGSRWLFRSTAGDPGTLTPYQSRGTAFACITPDSGSKVLRTATPVMDLLAEYPPEYTVE